jgi:hypothetical protein
MLDYLEIGPSPVDEECVQLGCDDYARKARIECLQYIEALRKKLGLEPSETRLFVKCNPHDFGFYYEVACDYNSDNEESTKYAFDCESKGPVTWAEVGMKTPKFD